jgi:maltose alpha-D-glucosyltransferase/alpha-amylase
VTVSEVVPLLADPFPAWMSPLVVQFAERPSETYWLPLAIALGRSAREVQEASPGAVIARIDGTRGRGVLFDGTASDAVSRALLELIHGNRSAAGRCGELRGASSFALRPLYEALEEPPSVHRLGGEQSNTSVRFDSQLILKLVRRFEPGVHPEIEFGRHLTERVGFERAPRYAGALLYRATDGEPGAVATLQQWAWSQGDAWTYAVGEVRRFLEEESGAPFESVADELRAVPIFADSARQIGVRTAELHLALADARGDPDFEPEPFARADVQALVARIRERLTRLAPTLRGPAQEAYPAETQRIIDAADDNSSRIVEPVTRGNELVQKIRCHGDYHLGQLLWARGDFTIVDFEGAVGHPLAERRAKASVFTDVAGMLRSFQYAVLFALREHVATLPDPNTALERAEPWARWFEQCSAMRFLEGYYATAGEALFVPRSSTVRIRLLNLHLLDKALHELEYELNHRPDWVDLPLRGVASMLRRLEDDAP